MQARNGAALGALGMVLACSSSDPTEPDPPDQIEHTADFTDPNVCAGCHERQFAEWQSSMMAYASVSPVFNALESAGNRFTHGEFAADGEDPLFCQNCHSPISVAQEEFPSFVDMSDQPSRDFQSETGKHGVSCDFCHQVVSPDFDRSLLGDGIANVSLTLSPRAPKQGPIREPVDNGYHLMKQNGFIQTSGFCGGCHDVRLSPPDAVTGEPFTRLENAFTEWATGPYATPNNPYGKVTTCQDCHMSAYPYDEPGVYFEGRVAVSPADTPIRRVATHYFTGVDIAFIDFPGQDDPSLDTHGLPIGQKQRREDLLRAACTVEIDAADSATPGTVFPLGVTVTNVGAGHNVPTGFSQERQVWIELTVTDGSGALVYQSGHLEDVAHPETGEMQPDGNLDDEDLQNIIGVIDPDTFETPHENGPDFNQRPAKNLGLVNFGNEFRRVTPDGDEEVFIPFIANVMDNGHSLPPMTPVRNQYDIEIPPNAISPISVAVRLRFRPFPPRFLRMLVAARPDLVSESIVDKNVTVDMADSQLLIPLGSRP